MSSVFIAYLSIYSVGGVLFTKSQHARIYSSLDWFDLKRTPSVRLPTGQFKTTQRSKKKKKDSRSLFDRIETFPRLIALRVAESQVIRLILETART